MIITQLWYVFVQQILIISILGDYLFEYLMDLVSRLKHGTQHQLHNDITQIFYYLNISEYLSDLFT